MHPEQHSELLEARLRALPPPPVPRDLEARLIAAVPPAGTNPLPPETTRIGWRAPIRKQRRRLFLAAVASGLAAACLLTFLGWRARRPEAIVPVVLPHGSDSVRRDSSPVLETDAKLAPRLEARRVLGGSEQGAFVWPVESPMPATLASRIPPDLLN
jgi:hypothetical protein